MDAGSVFVLMKRNPAFTIWNEYLRHDWPSGSLVLNIFHNSDDLEKVTGRRWRVLPKRLNFQPLANRVLITESPSGKSRIDRGYLPIQTYLGRREPSAANQLHT